MRRKKVNNLEVKGATERSKGSNKRDTINSKRECVTLEDEESNQERIILEDCIDRNIKGQGEDSKHSIHRIHTSEDDLDSFYLRHPVIRKSKEEQLKDMVNKVCNSINFERAEKSLQMRTTSTTVGLFNQKSKPRTGE